MRYLPYWRSWDGVSGLELIDALFDLTKSTNQPIIAIDGPAGAGKTTLASHLSAALSLKYKCTVIHMDQIYNGWSTPFDEHFTEALLQIVKAHKKAEAIPLAQYNWHESAYDERHLLPASQLLILEGVASTHSLIRDELSASLWIEIEPKIGLDRVLARDGKEISDEMNQWLVLQAQHFTENDSQMKADFVLTT
jgi:uridine kinase